MVSSRAQSPLDEDRLYPCRWAHCGDAFPLIQSLHEHLDGHAAAAAFVQLGGRKRRKLGKGMWQLVGNQHDAFHVASQAGNTTTTTTSTDLNTSASQALGPPSFPSLPPRPIFSSPPASPYSPDAAQVSMSMPMPSLAYDLPPPTQPDASDSPFLSSRPRTTNPFAAHSPLAQQFRQELECSGMDGNAPPHGGDAAFDALPSQVAHNGGGGEWPAPDSTGKSAPDAQAQDVSFTEYLRLPFPDADHTPESAADDEIGTQSESELAPSQSPFIPPTQAFGAGVSLLTSTPLEQIMEQDSSGSMAMDLDSSLDMPVEVARGAHTGNAGALADLEFMSDFAHLSPITPGKHDESLSRPSTPPLPGDMMNDQSGMSTDDEEEDSIAAELFSTPLGAAEAIEPVLTSPLPAQGTSQSLLPDATPADRSPLKTTKTPQTPSTARRTASFGLPMTFGSALATRTKSWTAVGVFEMGSQAVRHNFGGSQASPGV